jgi:hypothetical protein
MLQHHLALVGAGSLPEVRMRRAAEAIASVWDRPLRIHACGEDPDRLLAEFTADVESQLLRLCGDAACERPGGSSWLEALAAWRIPTLLIASPNADGSMPGVVPAYVALCSSLRLPLIGLIQLDGHWQPERRRRDGLPWCGVISTAGSRQELEGAHALTNLLKLRLQALAPVAQGVALG